MNIPTLVLTCMEEAEKFSSYSSQQKKEFVMEGMRLLMTEAKFDSSVDIIEDTVELLIQLSKNKTIMKLNRKIKYSCLKLCK